VPSAQYLVLGKIFPANQFCLAYTLTKNIKSGLLSSCSTAQSRSRFFIFIIGFLMFFIDLIVFYF